MAEPVLFQFPVSHFCEKVRWALDYKKIPFTTRDLMPLFHMPVIFRLTRQNRVPVLLLDNRYIVSSDVIIQTLEERFPSAPALYPLDDDQREQALEWARMANRELGPHVRRAAYFHLIDHSQLMYEILTSGQRSVRKMAFRASQPLVLKAMKESMGLTRRGAERSLERIRGALERLDSRLSEHPYLVGDQFTVADLTVASLLAPLVLPAEAPFQFPGALPDEYKAFCDTFSGRPSMEWVERIYTRHR